MDTVDYLKSEHDQIRSFYLEYTKAENEGIQIKLLVSFVHELQSLSKVVLTILFPVFDKFDDAKPLVASLLTEHKKVLRAMKSVVDALKTDRKNTQPAMKELAGSVNTFFDHVEKDLFPLMKQHMKRPEREALTRHMQSYFNEVKKTRAA